MGLSFGRSGARRGAERPQCRLWRCCGWYRVLEYVELLAPFTYLLLLLLVPLLLLLLLLVLLMLMFALLCFRAKEKLIFFHVRNQLRFLRDRYTAIQSLASAAKLSLRAFTHS